MLAGDVGDGTRHLVDGAKLSHNGHRLPLWFCRLCRDAAVLSGSGGALSPGMAMCALVDAVALLRKALFAVFGYSIFLNINRGRMLLQFDALRRAGHGGATGDHRDPVGIRLYRLF